MLARFALTAAFATLVVAVIKGLDSLSYANPAVIEYGILAMMAVCVLTLCYMAARAVLD